MGNGSWKWPAQQVGASAQDSLDSTFPPKVLHVETSRQSCGCRADSSKGEDVAWQVSDRPYRAEQLLSSKDVEVG